MTPSLGPQGRAASDPVAVRRDALASLFGRATAEEQGFLVKLAGGELRQGALAGMMVDAVARAASVDAPAVRRAAMLAGDLPAVAETALVEGAPGLERFRLEVGRPLQPMLAKTATSVEAAMEQIGGATAIDWKIDGVRIQVHRDRDDVAVFTRTLDPITERVPEVVEAALALPVRSIVLDGEAIALRPDGRPRPFQQTASRAASRGDVDALRREVPLTPFFFDVLRMDDAELIDLPAVERQASVEGVVPADLWVPRLVTTVVDEAQAFFDDAVARGHEGVVVKSLDAPYEAGRRGGAWLKVKPVHTLDLVVLAAEWGHGRRTGWLSNLHLGARDPAGGGFVMLGKTFKGLTDELLRWQTERFWSSRRTARGSRCSSAPRSSWRSRSTASRRVRGIRPAWRCGSRASSVTAKTRTRTRRTRSRPCGCCTKPGCSHTSITHRWSFAYTHRLLSARA